MNIRSPSFPEGLSNLRSESEARGLPVLPAPCPFCGEDPPLAAMKLGPVEFTNYVVGCESDDCHANPQVSGKTVAEAWARWNKRAVPKGAKVIELPSSADFEGGPK